MAVIARRIKRFTGEVTTDGSGNAATDIVFGSAGGARSESYKLIKVVVTNGANDATKSTPLTGGTVVVRDNSGAGSAVNFTITQATDLPSAGSTFIKTLDAPTPVTNVRLTTAGGGASKKFTYALWFARTRAH
jgi:hypothetical protein